MEGIDTHNKETGFGTAPVYLTAISTILGAILFLRFGYATGELGFFGVVLIIVLGHAITIPTALAISEISTNTRVEGGGEYFIISRSFGLKIGSTIGIALYISQAVSVAFYIIAFAEAFEPLFNWWKQKFEYELPRQVISIPSLCILSYIILKKGAGSGMKLLYIVNAILILSLLFFFIGKPITGNDSESVIIDNFKFLNKDSFFVIFAICFPAFTGITAGVGLSGDLRNPGKSIPLGTIAGTFTGLTVYLLVVWKLAVSAPAADLAGNQLIMSKIAVWGAVIIPFGLASCTLSSAIGSFIVAPRTLQAIALDKSFPVKRINTFFAHGKGAAREPVNASVLTFLIAFVFVIMGSVDAVAGIISMFFLISYGSLCLISFLNHFGSPPSYRPRFKSKWYISLGGFLLSVWAMFRIDSLYTVLSYAVIVVLYLIVEHYNKDQKGLVNIFKGSIFQLNRRLQVYMQKNHSGFDNEEWRPAAICISQNSFEREKVLELMKWISHKHGFGTYFHYIEGYYSRQTYLESRKILAQLITQRESGSFYIDTMISPSYTSAIAQIIQSPSISGMENNMVMFEFDRNRIDELERILENINLVKSGDFDICILGTSSFPVRYRNGIHVWIRSVDDKNTNLMILLGYIILSHPEWSKSYIKILNISPAGKEKETKKGLEERIAAGRLPITLTNIEIVTFVENQAIGEVITEYSKYAGLTIIGFREEIIKHNPAAFFSDFHGIGDILFVNASTSRNID
jgi:amino acid transporter